MSLVSAKTVGAAAASGTGAQRVAAAIGEAGVATVLSGTTSIVVGTFAGLDGSVVLVGFAEDPTAATHCWYAWDGSDELTLHVDQNPTANADLAYNIKKAE